MSVMLVVRISKGRFDSLRLDEVRRLLIQSEAALRESLTALPDFGTTTSASTRYSAR
jgi:hypothetical protein